LGASAILIGLYMMFPPLAFVVGGLAAVMIGEKL